LPTESKQLSGGLYDIRFTTIKDLLNYTNFYNIELSNYFSFLKKKNENTAFVEDINSIADENHNNFLYPGTITNISPSNIRAGAGEKIIITGTGFGTIEQYVWMNNADYDLIGTSTTRQIKIPEEYVIWTNTQITVEIP
jgi:hypothetical protein